ncbi:MAG TPA: DUF2207 domain-containing protein [Candidatus Andersenbacteria bacterium]|nr:DUF2207 domain-containing protein [Candidatus Andersenbacteria bacterium]
MKKLIGVISFLFIGVFLFPISTIKAQAPLLVGEKISRFASDFSVKSDGSLAVVETIQYDFGGNSKHGIFRTIPLGFKAKGEPYHTTIKVQSVTDELKNPYPFTITSKDPLNIKIGDPDIVITGLHTYVISYTVYSSIGFFDAYDELYWNVTGNAWEVPIETVQATVRLPERISFDNLQLSRYCGMEGEQKICGTFTENERGDIEFYTLPGDTISPGEQVTIAVGFSKGMVPVPNTWDFILSFIQHYWFIPFPFLIAYLWFRKRLNYWHRRRSYYRAHTIIAEYDAGSFNPLEAAVLVNGKAEFKDITALIVSLAIRGFLKIEKKDDEFFFTKLKNADPKNSEYEQLLLDDLANTRESELDSTFGSHAAAAMLSAAKGLSTREYIPEKTLKPSLTPGFLPIWFAFFLALNPGLFIWVFLGQGLGITFSGACILIGILYLFLKPKSSYLLEKGFAAERKLLGLKLYIQVAEEDRITFANAPAKTPELFEKLLPYAMVFGLEKKWAKEFEHIYTTPPSWYTGNMGAFSSLVFIQSINSISYVTKQAIAASVPSSSKSSWGGSSGSSGGGSSGGGGGGGGGGSW